MIRRVRRTGRKVRTGLVKLSLTLAAAIALLSTGALPAYAWSPTIYPTIQSATAIVIGGSPSSITDSAPIRLPADGPGTAAATACGTGATLYGCIIFKVYKVLTGTACGTSTLSSSVFTSIVHVTGATNTKVTYTSAAFTPTVAGTYVWMDTYSGTGNPVGSGNNYPSASFACEAFTVTGSHGVPEFPIGLPLLMAFALPALMLLRRRLPQASLS